MDKKSNNGNKKSKSKAKQKFVPLFSKEGEARTVAQLPGRHHCQCLASRHKLIGNCIKCGRIVCKQEGSGPCFTCGALVCTKEEKEIIQRGDRKGEELYTKLMNSNSSDSKNQGLKEIANALLPDQNTQEGLEKALQHKKQLLEYDRTCERRTQVIDDDADYFSTDSNQWLSPEERKRLTQLADDLKSKKYMPRSKRKITVDFAGRQIEEDNIDLYDINNPVIQEIFFSEHKKNGAGHSSWEEDDERITDAVSNLRFEESAENIGIPKPVTLRENERCRLRLQDSGLQEMSDEGWCLSAHQPYASLIVLGIKKHEGRTWYTPHRGRLWIAAAAKQPSCKEVIDIENAMKIIHGNCVFPEQYPVSCLLGCVDLVDCLSQEQYMEQYPEGESGSPYVFICENPKELIVKFPVQGRHKLYKLDERIHQAALKMIMKKPTTHS